MRERDSGFGYPEDLSEFEKELAMVWDETVAATERALRMRQLIALESVLRMGNAG